MEKSGMGLVLANINKKFHVYINISLYYQSYTEHLFSLDCNLFFEKIYVNLELVKFWSVFSPFNSNNRLFKNMNFLVGFDEYYHPLLTFPLKLGHTIVIFRTDELDFITVGRF